MQKGLDNSKAILISLKEILEIKSDFFLINAKNECMEEKVYEMEGC